jgi:uncharacterized protein
MAAKRTVRAWFLLLLIAVAPVLLPRASHAGSAPKFPPLTGRVVDQANILSDRTKARLTRALEDFEQETKRQVVVVTVPDLQGFPIEDFGYQLGRAWGIGEKGKDTGAILLVAVKDRRVRIEVGYGLEGELTDARSRQIIEQTILPHFRAGDFDTGVITGTLAILHTLGWKGDGTAPERPQQVSQRESLPGFLLPLGMFLLFMFLTNRARRGRGRIYRRGGPFIIGGLGGAGFGRGGFGGGGGGFGGGFSGGGGSFGGGGASGRW